MMTNDCCPRPGPHAWMPVRASQLQRELGMITDELRPGLGPGAQLPVRAGQLQSGRT